MAELKFKKQARLLKLLANPVRLEILAALSRQTICVRNLEELVSRRQANISQHLSILRHAGLIDFDRRGRKVCYFIVDKKTREVVRILERRLS